MRFSRKYITVFALAALATCCTLMILLGGLKPAARSERPDTQATEWLGVPNTSYLRI